MNNKNKLILVAITIMIMVVSSTITLAASGVPALKMSFINQDPDPAQPGEYVKLKFKMENEGSGLADNVKVQFNENFPFSLDPGSESIKNLGTIGGEQKDELGVVFEYRVRISAQAVEGSNKAEISFWEEGKTPQRYEFDIDVKTQDSGLAIKSVEADNLEPGKEGVITLNVENPSDSTVRDVAVSLELNAENLPFAPADSATTKRVKFLEESSISKFRFNLIPFPEADTKVYKIPIKLSYYDSTNQFVEKSDIIGVTVGAKTDLSVTVDSSEFPEGATKGTLTLNFINKGLIDVKFLDVFLEDTEDYEVISSNEAYIGNVDSDDFENADFRIMKKNGANPFDIQAKITYKDANNKDYSDDKNIEVKLYPSEVQKSNTGLYILVVIVLIVGYIIYRKIKKGKKKR